MNIQEFDYTADLTQAILWQYNKAVNIQKLIGYQQDFFNKNHVQFWQDWYTNVFNLQTANDFGLYVWSILLQLPIQLSPIPPVGQKIWGFGQYRKNFNNGNFAVTSDPYNLSTEEKRLVLKLRYFQLVTNGAVTPVNKFLNFAFQDLGECYIIDNLDMSITVIFGFIPRTELLDFIKRYDLMPRCTGVGIKYKYKYQNIWGFGQFRKNFNNGNFTGEL